MMLPVQRWMRWRPCLSCKPARLRAHRRIPARSKKYRNIFSVGVCVAIPPVEPTPVATGAPQDGLHDRDHGHGHLATTSPTNWLASRQTAKGTWNAICLADMVTTARLVALPQIPLRKRQLVQEGQVGAPGQDWLREALHA